MGTNTYTTVTQYFIQDDPKASEQDFGGVLITIPPRFGLKDDSDDRWQKFKREIERLNSSALATTQYKVIFLGRHGQGYHNVAIAKYSIEEWYGCWTKLDGHGGLVWGPDPELTELGLEQARDAHRAWKKELGSKIPLPQRLYSSPLRRAIKTHQLTFEGLLGPDLKTTIVENIREKNGVSTCDKRRGRSEIQKDFPEYLWEDGFTEEDETWDPEIRETPEELECRATKVLDMIFDEDKEQFISITSHHGFIDAFLRVCHHRPWDLPTGGIIPVVVKADKQAMLN
ncbi:phosphoglycerate mutase-like protein [Gyrodon lividus]|nr:phosphoglycerate mutase-like protein [Gyrodon lividus]